MEVNDRIKVLRSHLGLTQTEFGDKIGFKQNTIGQMESGSRGITDRTIILICQTFDISEAWLRTGRGEMFSLNEDANIAELAKEFSLDHLGQAILKGYMHLGDYEKAVIGKYIKSVAAEYASEDGDGETVKIPAVGGVKEIHVSKEQRMELGQLKDEVKEKDDSDELV